MSEALDALAERLERLSAQPEQAATGMKRVVAPVLRVLKWQPALRTARLSALMDALEAGEPASPANQRTVAGDSAPDRPTIEELLEGAVRELEENTSKLEQACAVDGHPPPGHVTWLHRLWKILRRAERVARGDVPWHPPDASLLAPPLVESSGRAPGPASAVDPLLASARAEQATLGRRRRLLEAARQLLLESAAASSLDPEAVRARQSYIAQEIALIDRLQAAGLSPEVSLIHQARTAVTRGDVQKAHAALIAMDGAATRSGDFALARLTGKGIDALWKGRDRFDERACAESLARSGAEMFSPEVRDVVNRGVAEGRRRLLEIARGQDPDARNRAKHALQFLDERTEEALILSALHVDGCFDVGGVLCPQRAVEEHRRVRRVAFPTQDLALLPARTVEDLPEAVIEDPRRILHDFAAGRLLTRRYVVEETTYAERTVMRGEVRAYVLDGSGSMLGPRAHMRDAILLAELSTLITRYADRLRRVEPILHYRYFDVEPGPVTRVDSASSALAAIENVVSTVHRGGTDIQRALLATLDDIRVAREGDDALARAQIVLVTDGVAPIDRDAVLSARAAVGEIPVGISIIALGQENQALRDLAAHQRSRGEAVFYQYIPDDELAAITAGKKGLVSIHLPEELAPADLKRELSAVVEEIEALRRLREDPAAGDTVPLTAAFDEVGLSSSDEVASAARARIDLARRDEAALCRVFDRWFPETDSREPLSPEAIPKGEEADALADVQAVLASTIAVIDLVGSTSLERKIDAIDLVERLLADAGIPPWRYADLLRRYPALVRKEIDGVRAAVCPPGSATNRAC